MNEPVYDLSTGEIIQYPRFEYQMLIYHAEPEFKLISKDQYPQSSSDLSIHVQLVKMDSVENINDIITDYLENRRDCNYPSFIVLHDDICDVYVLGRRFLDHHDIFPIDEDDDDIIDMDFWIARYRYPRNEIVRAIIDWTVQDFFNMTEQMSGREDVPTQVVASVEGGTIVGHTANDNVM
ncbi:hypothetical protein EV177_005773 [Coemansia sp. RSA 1804]|nr:hypothetical protein EV177_005773 [Coemansia sp. RSA 1804]